MISIMVILMTIQSPDSWNTRSQTVYSGTTIGAMDACRAVGNSWINEQARKKEVPKTNYAYYCKFDDRNN